MSDKINETVTPTEIEVDVLEKIIQTSDEELMDHKTEVVEEVPEPIVTPLESAVESVIDKETSNTKTLVNEDVVLDDQNKVNDTIDTVKQVTVSTLKGVSQTIFDRLTKKNQQYLLSVAKQLEADNLDTSASSAVFTEIAETLIQGQKTGQTAKHLYGTPTECANIIRDQHFPKEVKKEDVPSAPKYIALDGSLLLGSIYTLMTGVSMMNTRIENVGVGLLTLIVNYIVAGFAMLLIARNLPNPDAPKGEKGYFRYFGMATLAMLSWVAAVSLTTAFIPPVINPLLPASALIIIGGITLVARFYIKKRFNIKGGVF